jgi:hypothetical protein
MNNDKDKLLDLSESQLNPYLARPEDFIVTKANEAANQTVPGHGQHGDSAREYRHLLKQSARQPDKSKFTADEAETIKQQASSK